MTSYAKRMDGIRGSVIRELAKYLSDPEMISFGGGNPSDDSFPVEIVDEISGSLLKDKGAALLQYGVTEGYRPLREAYIEHIAQPKGLPAEISNVLILTGSMQGLDLICKLFVDPGDTVLVEAPSFAGALQAFRISQANIVSVAMDDEGILPDDLEEKFKKHKPKIFYCIPTFQNPTGKTLLLERRKKVAELASKYDVIVIEDDPYCDLRYRGGSVPSIKKFDETGNVVLLHSFSKILSPGLRVGVMMASAEIVDKAGICKQCSDTHTANFNQAIAAEYLSRGLLEPHLKKILPSYAAKLDTMLKAIDAHFPKECKFVRPDGGLYVWGELPGEIDMPAMHQRALKERKVAFVPGMAFYADKPALGKKTLRLNFSNASPESIKTGVERLALLVKEYL